VPSQDDREISVLVNYSEKDAARELSVPCAAGAVTLSLQARMPGVVVTQGQKVQAVESSADVCLNHELLIGGDLHFMAIALRGQTLDCARAMLLLPMGEGRLILPNVSRWHHPIALVGEVLAGEWKQYESFVPSAEADSLKLPISAARSLSMMVLCEEGEQKAAIQELETAVSKPWLASH
jgi:hypothetical protein